MYGTRGLKNRGLPVLPFDRCLLTGVYYAEYLSNGKNKDIKDRWTWANI